MQVQGITWHAVVLERDEFAAKKKLLVDVFGLTAAIDADGYSMFPMPDGTILDLYAPDAIPAYGFNDGIVFGFRVSDIEAASAELAEAGCELLGEINHVPEMSYAYRHFRGPAGRVYGINEQR
jgi:predicted enzyme related to lactoylglutathione lyase